MERFVIDYDYDYEHEHEHDEDKEEKGAPLFGRGLRPAIAE
jgi:hypothetical protein